MKEFTTRFISEPDLIFGHGGEDKDPRLGLRKYGPYFSPSEPGPSPSRLRVGIIGSGTTRTLAQDVLARLTRLIPSDEPNRWVYPDFPGFARDSPVECEIVTTGRWNAIISQAEIDSTLEVTDVNERIAAASRLVGRKVESVSMEEDAPHVVVCALPAQIEEYCGISPKTRGAKRPRPTELEVLLAQLEESDQEVLERWGFEFDQPEPEAPRLDYDLRNSLKGRAMKIGIPIQILRESTARGFLDYPSTQFPLGDNEATFAWNFSMALYYKGYGRPWRLAKLVGGTCYVGISFYVNKRDPRSNIETAMAQIFTHTGEGFVLRGADVVVDERTKEAHLTEAQSEDLMQDIISKYSQKVGTPPSRVVVHKTSSFTEAEKSGILKVLADTPVDFLAIRDRTDIRWMRLGNYPLLRGTVIVLNPREYLIYTRGYTPRLRTYQGPRIPVPLHVLHAGDSDAQTVCEEIMGLTKLNWNTTQFATKNPITLEFAHRVGEILSELPDGYPVQDHYRFYM